MSNANNHQNCPISILMSLLSGPWTLYILWAICNKGPIRFGALSREIQGISTKVLTERLRMLEAEGILYREYQPTIPPQVSYGLTARGRELMGIIEQLDTIAQRWYGSEKTEAMERDCDQGEHRSNDSLIPQSPAPNTQDSITDASAVLTTP